MTETTVDTRSTVHVQLQFDVEKLVELTKYKKNSVQEFSTDFFKMFQLLDNQNDERVKKFDFDFSTYTIDAEIVLEKWIDFSTEFATFVNAYGDALNKIEAREMPYTDSDYDSDNATLYSTVTFGQNVFPVKGTATFTPIFGWVIRDTWESISAG